MLPRVLHALPRLLHARARAPSLGCSTPGAAPSTEWLLHARRCALPRLHGARARAPSLGSAGPWPIKLSRRQEANQKGRKQINDLQEKYNSELQHSADLSKKLEATEKYLDHTSNLLSTTKEDLIQAHYNLKEKDFIIFEQKKAENALAHQACVLRSDLEKSSRDKLDRLQNAASSLEEAATRDLLMLGNDA